jgi:hypothetical protein
LATFLSGLRSAMQTAIRMVEMPIAAIVRADLNAVCPRRDMTKPRPFLLIVAGLELRSGTALLA